MHPLLLRFRQWMPSVKGSEAKECVEVVEFIALDKIGVRELRKSQDTS